MKTLRRTVSDGDHPLKSNTKFDWSTGRDNRAATYPLVNVAGAFCPALHRSRREVANDSSEYDVVALPSHAERWRLPSPNFGRNETTPVAESLPPRGGSMAAEADREATFTRWPKGNIVHPKDLAGAGFYHIGRGDSVQCYVCCGVLYNWVAGDIPLVEHRKHFPECSFAASRPDGEVPRTNLSREGSDDALLSHPVISEVLSMGFAEDAVTNVVQRHLDATGHSFQTVEQLVEALLEGDDPYDPGYDIPPDEELAPWQFNGRMTPIDESEMNFPEPELEATFFPPLESHVEPTSSINDDDDDEPRLEDAESLAVENRRLKEEKVCRICYDRERDIVFMPCGHLVTCAVCAFSVKTCPICRQLILSTLRVYK